MLYDCESCLSPEHQTSTEQSDPSKRLQLLASQKSGSLDTIEEDKKSEVSSTIFSQGSSLDLEDTCAANLFTGRRSSLENGQNSFPEISDNLLDYLVAALAANSNNINKTSNSSSDKQG